MEKNGFISLDNETINKKNICSIRNSKIIVISHRYDFLDDLTIKENVDLCLNLYNSNENKLDDTYKVVNLSLSEINEKGYLNKKSNELPNIIQFKFSLVMALIKNPKILIFDDPSNCFSNQTALEIVKILKELSKSTNNRFHNTYDEISINTILAKDFVKYGCYIILDNSKALEQFRPSKIDDLIGKRLYNGYKIVGVYSSADGVEEYFEPYI